MFTYDIHAIYVKHQTYIRLSVKADSFIDAVSEFFRKNKRPKSGDLALMAHYDGQTYSYKGTFQKKYFLSTKEGRQYVWNGEKFIMDDESWKWGALVITTFALLLLS